MNNSLKSPHDTILPSTPSTETVELLAAVFFVVVVVVSGIVVVVVSEVVVVVVVSDIVVVVSVCGELSFSLSDELSDVLSETELLSILLLSAVIALSPQAVRQENTIIIDTTIAIGLFFIVYLLFF